MSQCGIFMGCPLTWITLTILHSFWAKEAHRDWTSRLPHNISLEKGPMKGYLKQPFRICGDDLIGLFQKGYY